MSPFTLTKKTKAAVSNSLMPYLLVGTLGLGGGGLGTQLLGSGITPQQLEMHMNRLLDKIEDLDERLDKLERGLERVEDELDRDRYSKGNAGADADDDPNYHGPRWDGKPRIWSNW